ncbi:MAG: gamma-glutamyltransferase [Alphaproteobacteria bacterium]|nr:MAG: gamma-glutamyltransferase [Alphaproteobacteria bacterium]
MHHRKGGKSCRPPLVRGFLCGFFLSTLIGMPIARAAETPPARATAYMIAAANPLAVRAGREILRAGGSAIDAAIAAQMVLNLVEPQSSGIGGGGFLLYYEAASGTVTAYDGRETAPAAVTPELFLDADGKPMAFWDAVVGGRSVGVPGLLRMLEMAHRAHGRLAWASLFAPAIRLADAGFPVSPRLNRLIAEDRYLKRFAATAAYFYDPAGNPRPVGYLLRNPAFAETLRRIARDGADALYTGPIAAAIVAAVRGATGNPGAMTLDDLANYRAKRRAPVCAAYRRWQVCGMPPPTSGGVATLQILGILSQFDLAALAPNSTAAVHLITEASRLAFADRNRFLGDPDFVPVPVDRLLAPDYLARRARLIGPDASLGKAVPGLPIQNGAMPHQPAPPSTTHMVVVDAAGNVVSMTASIESAFGSRLMAAGFLLNNELTDFSFRPRDDAGRLIANRVEPGKRPRSSMAPTIILDRDGGFAVALGSPGGSRIIGYVVKALIATLDWGLDIQAAIDLPNFVNRNGPTDLEKGTVLETLVLALRALGHEVRVRSLVSGLHGIARRGGILTGGADPRREGVAAGD